MPAWYIYSDLSPPSPLLNGNPIVKVELKLLLLYAENTNCPVIETCLPIFVYLNLSYELFKVWPVLSAGVYSPSSYSSSKFEVEALSAPALKSIPFPDVPMTRFPVSRVVSPVVSCTLILFVSLVQIVTGMASAVWILKILPASPKYPSLSVSVSCNNICGWVPAMLIPCEVPPNPPFW